MPQSGDQAVGVEEDKCIKSDAFFCMYSVAGMTELLQVKLGLARMQRSRMYLYYYIYFNKELAHGRQKIRRSQAMHRQISLTKIDYE